MSGKTRRIYDGGSAFPRSGDDELLAIDGMSVRIWLAGMALSNPRIADGKCAESDAVQCMEWADAILSQPDECELPQ